MLTLADTHRTRKRRRPDREKEDLQKEVLQEENVAKTAVYQGFQSSPKSHYMYNVPLIPKVARAQADK